MNKTDFKKSLDCYQAEFHKFRIVTVPALQYLMIGGHGDPNSSQEFQDAVKVLYPLAYSLKFASKRELGKDYVVMPLKGLWWADDMETFTAKRDKSKWDFTLMIMQPDWITPGMFADAVQKVAKKDPLPLLSKVQLKTITEGTCVQTLHIGSYDDEADILAQMHNDFIPKHDLRMTKKHHEIYFSDFRYVAPNKLRTILRQPVVKA